MICQTEAIVLNQHKYGNSSLICNLFTASHGKINIIAKGARSLKNPNSAILQPCNCIEVVYYYKSTRNIQTLKEASSIGMLSNINQDYTKIMFALTIIEIINKISFHDNPCKIIFRLVKKTLQKINTTNNKSINLYYIFFQIQLLIYLGYYPSFLNCYQCSKKLDKGRFDENIGQLLCLQCSKKHTISICSSDLNILNFLMTSHINKIENNFNDYNTLNNINNLLFKFILFHIPELSKSKLFIGRQANV